MGNIEINEISDFGMCLVEGFVISVSERRFTCFLVTHDANHDTRCSIIWILFFDKLHVHTLDNCLTNFFTFRRRQVEVMVLRSWFGSKADRQVGCSAVVL